MPLENITPSWELEQFNKICYYQPDLFHHIIEQLWEVNTELKKQMIIGAYLDKKINLGKAAELLGIHRLELQEQFLKMGIPLRLGSSTIEEAQAETEAVKRWLNLTK